MLTLPHDPSDDASPTGEPQVVQLSEDARTLEHVFRLCCPVEHPIITTVNDVHAVLDAARKYDMAAITQNLRPVIQRILPREPLHVYAVAYMLEMEDVAREAADLLLDDPQFHAPVVPPPEFATLPARAVYAVHIYRERCAKAALDVLEDRDWILNGTHERAAKQDPVDLSQSWIWVACQLQGSSYGHSCESGPSGSGLTDAKGRSWTCRKWWWSYLSLLKESLAQRPSGRTVRGYLSNVHSSKALREAARCQNCMPRAYADLVLFNELLAPRVDAALAKVVIDLPFV